MAGLEERLFISPVIGEIRKGVDLGKCENSRNYMWQPCIVCLQPRWVGLRKGKPVSDRCMKCVGMEHAKEYQHLLKHGTKEESSRWKGGRYYDGQGYAFVYVNRNDPFYAMVSNKASYVYEHRLVMAKHLGRCLYPWEIVHHKNGVKDDNRIENLELFTNIHGHDILTRIQKYTKRMTGKIEKLEKENKKLRTKLRRYENSVKPQS